MSFAQGRNLPGGPTALGIMGDMELQVRTTTCDTPFSSHLSAFKCTLKGTWNKLKITVWNSVVLAGTALMSMMNLAF